MHDPWLARNSEAYRGAGNACGLLLRDPLRLSQRSLLQQVPVRGLRCRLALPRSKSLSLKFPAVGGPGGNFPATGTPTGGEVRCWHQMKAAGKIVAVERFEF